MGLVTHGDIAVLFVGLVLYGESFLSCLNGMWAFIFYDALTGEALLSRDRLGKKPLFYSGKAFHRRLLCCIRNTCS